MISAEYCRELFHYDHITGVFTWRVRKGQRGILGALAGSRQGDGYLQVQIDGRKHLLHRLAWLYMTGEQPAKLLDHIDGLRTNNAFANLRPADRSINSQNIKRHRRDNLAGLLGASRNGRGWKAAINLHGVRTYLGTFSTPQEAHAAYIEAKRLLHPANTL